MWGYLKYLNWRWKNDIAWAPIMNDAIPDSKVHGTSMGPTRVLPAPYGLHVGPMNRAITDVHDDRLLLYYNEAAKKRPPLCDYLQTVLLYENWGILQKSLQVTPSYPVFLFLVPWISEGYWRNNEDFRLRLFLAVFCPWWRHQMETNSTLLAFC